jgi:hypothetical protein
MIERLTTFALVSCLLAACGGGGGNVQTGPRGPLHASDFYPLGEEYIWTYDIDTQTGLTTLGIRRVVEARAPTFVVRMDGERTDHTYEVREGGVYDAGEDMWLLRDPLLVGQEWSSRGGRTARVTAVDQDVDVTAGHFEGCVVIEETGSESGPDFTTTYCPDQGPVIVESHQTLELSSRGITVRAELRAPVQRGMEDVEQPEEIDGPGR